MIDVNQFELNHASLNSTVVKWEEKDVESWINEKQIMMQAEKLKKSEYGKYLKVFIENLEK